MSSRFGKELHRLLRNFEKKANPQASIKDYDETQFNSFILELSPASGPYKHGKFLFQIQASEYYPDAPPDVLCLTDIYHPNIDPDLSSDHNICLNLFDEWNRTFGLEDCIQGLLYLLYNPNIFDPVSNYFDASMEYNTFLENVSKSLRGESVEGSSFQANYGWTEHQKKIEETNSNATPTAISDADKINEDNLLLDETESAAAAAAAAAVDNNVDDAAADQELTTCYSSTINEEIDQLTQLQSCSDSMEANQQQRGDHEEEGQVEADSVRVVTEEEGEGELVDSGRAASPSLSLLSDNLVDMLQLNSVGQDGDGDNDQPRDFVFCRFRPHASDNSDDSNDDSSDTCSTDDYNCDEQHSDDSSSQLSAISERQVYRRNYRRHYLNLATARNSRQHVIMHINDGNRIHVAISRRYHYSCCIRINGQLVYPGQLRLMLRAITDNYNQQICGLVSNFDAIACVVAACIRQLLLPPLL